MKPEDLLKLVTFVMPYGKYKGRILDLPVHYLEKDSLMMNWALIGPDAEDRL